MKPEITRQVELTVSPTIEELANMIIHLGSDEQAQLISKMAELATFSVPMQLQYVTDDPALTSEGRSLMSLIGDYAPASASMWVRGGGSDCERCHSDDHGECSWEGCPQLRDGEPAVTGRHCPLDNRALEDSDG
jgi:hypothetical protein